jgi:hypothetical protein
MGAIVEAALENADGSPVSGMTFVRRIPGGHPIDRKLYLNPPAPSGDTHGLMDFCRAPRPSDSYWQ